MVSINYRLGACVTLNLFIGVRDFWPLPPPLGCFGLLVSPICLHGAPVCVCFLPLHYPLPTPTTPQPPTTTHYPRPIPTNHYPSGARDLNLNARNDAHATECCFRWGEKTAFRVFFSYSFFPFHLFIGVLGFYTDPDLAITGNFAIMDQQLALRWVQDNAAAFGGDPDRVSE